MTIYNKYKFCNFLNFKNSSCYVRAMYVSKVK